MGKIWASRTTNLVIWPNCILPISLQCVLSSETISPARIYCEEQQCRYHDRNSVDFSHNFVENKSNVTYSAEEITGIKSLKTYLTFINSHFSYILFGSLSIVFSPKLYHPLPTSIYIARRNWSIWTKYIVKLGVRVWNGGGCNMSREYKWWWAWIDFPSSVRNLEECQWKT
jgi:hypothetical protein